MKERFLIVLFSIQGIILSAQTHRDYELFMLAAKENSLLYRGITPYVYNKKAPNDGTTYYAYSSSFEAGSLIFDGKLYHDVLLNLNADLDELYLKDNDGGTLLINKDFVDYCYIGSRKFINNKQEKIAPNFKNGYYEILYDGNTKLYKKIKKSYDETLLVDKTRIKSYELTVNYYLFKDGQYYKIKGKADFLMHHKAYKKEIKKVTKVMKFNFRAGKEQAFIEILQYLENNLIE